MFLVVGLGNPGEEYRDTRHNIGFMAADQFRRSRGMGRTRRRYHGRWCEHGVRGQTVGLLLPHTYMNHSGDAVAAAASGKHLQTAGIIVIHDDMDFPFGVVRAKQGGGAGGHNGLKSIIARLGTDGFNRVRIGIGRPEDPKQDPSDWVLGPLGVPGEQLRPVLSRAADCVEAIIASGIEAAMGRFNRKEPETGGQDMD